MQRNVQTLTTSLADVLAEFKDDPGGPRRRESVQPRNVLTSDQSSSYSPRGRRRLTKHNEYDLRDMKFDPPDFEETLNPNVPNCGEIL